MHDKFCYSQVLEHLWCQGHIPVPFVHFFSTLLSSNYRKHHVNYVRCFKGKSILAEAMFRLQVACILKHRTTDNYAYELQLLLQVQKCVASNNIADNGSLWMIPDIGKLLDDFELFIDQERLTSEQFLYWDNCMRLVSLLRNLLRAHMEGLCKLHLDTVQKLLQVFAVFDCTNSLHWCSLYLDHLVNWQIRWKEHNLFICFNWFGESNTGPKVTR